MNSNIELSNVKFSEQSSTAKYLQSMKQFPILSAEEEYNLTKEYFIWTVNNKKIYDKIINKNKNIYIISDKSYLLK